MSRDFRKFDNFKFALANKWRCVSVYDTNEIEKLNIKGHRALVFALINKGLNPYIYIERSSKKIKQEIISFKITRKDKKEVRNCENTLDRFLECD